MLDVFTTEVAPMFYDRDTDGVPTAWVARMKASLRTMAWRFTATRMMREYATSVYTS